MRRRASLTKNIFWGSFLIFVLMPQAGLLARGSGGNMPSMGIPISGFMASDPSGEDISPEGAGAINRFLEAWHVEDYASMYSLLDEKSLNGYTFEQAKFDFQFIEFKPYSISSVRKSGENYEFFLSYGDWRSGDKEMRKMVVNGENYKIVLQRDRSFFSRSL